MNFFSCVCQFVSIKYLGSSLVGFGCFNWLCATELFLGVLKNVMFFASATPKAYWTRSIARKPLYPKRTLLIFHEIHHVS